MFPCRPSNRLDNPVDILHHFPVPEPHHTPSFVVQIARPRVISPDFLRCRVRRAINLDNQSCFNTGKVHNERSNRGLSPEPIPNRSATQLRP